VKKVISYSLYGNKPKYIEGLRHNINLLDEVFSDPSWIFRVYYDDSVDESKLISHDRAEYIKVENDKNYMFWRFYTWDDPEVDLFISRDIDDRLNFWDYNIISEWEKTDCDFITCRHHMQHSIPVMGGLWGAKPRKFSFSMKELINKYSSTHPTSKYFNDQNFLCEVLWPLVAKKSLSVGFFWGHECKDHLNLPLDYHGLKKQTPMGNASLIDGKLVIKEHNITECGGSYNENQPNWESKCYSTKGYHSEGSDLQYESLKSELSKIKILNDPEVEKVMPGVPVWHIHENKKFLFV